MTWIALGLMALATALVAINTAAGRWNMNNWRVRWSGPPFRDWTQRVAALTTARSALDSTPTFDVPEQALLTAWRTALDNSEFFVFSKTVVFAIFVSFLLPVWSLSFATEAMGSEREGSNLVWLLTRPLSRPAIYLAKFVALLPWSLGLNLGGFALLCAVAGRPGALAFRLFWPSVLWGTLAFSALFHLAGTFFRRPAIVGLVYAFFLEVLLGNMPGYLKRVSISFYVRCLMFDAAQNYGVQPEKPWVYLPVDGTTACLVLAGATTALVFLGMLLFSRSEYVGVD
jgi:hypothetical protein